MSGLVREEGWWWMRTRPTLDSQWKPWTVALYEAGKWAIEGEAEPRVVADELIEVGGRASPPRRLAKHYGITPLPDVDAATRAKYEPMLERAEVASKKLLDVAVEMLGEEAWVDPQLVACTLMMTLGRHAGRYGFRHVDPKAHWAGIANGQLEPLFQAGYRAERNKEH